MGPYYGKELVTWPFQKRASKVWADELGIPLSMKRQFKTSGFSSIAACGKFAVISALHSDQLHSVVITLQTYHATCMHITMFPKLTAAESLKSVNRYYTKNSYDTHNQSHFWKQKESVAHRGAFRMRHPLVQQADHHRHCNYLPTARRLSHLHGGRPSAVVRHHM